MTEAVRGHIELRNRMGQITGNLDMLSGSSW